MDCYKCRIRPARRGGLCDTCHQGTDYGPNWTPKEPPSFQQYKAKELNPVAEVEAIAKADEELLLYDFYEKTQRAVPTLKYPYKPEYAKLEEWFVDRFFGLLGERIKALGSLASTDPLVPPEDIRSRFLSFRRSITDIGQSLTLSTAPEGAYPGMIPNALLMLLIRKIIKSTNGNYLSADEVAADFSPGSALFFLELFAQMRETELLSKFLGFISRLSDQDVRNILNRPLVLPTLWDHQKDALGNWLTAGAGGIIEMATATGKTLIGLAAIERLANQRGRLSVRVLAHSRAILNQWRREAIDKLGLPDNPDDDYTIGLRCNGVRIDFNTIQSVYSSPWKYPTDFLIVDEVHHGAAYMFRNALMVSCSYKMGLSATIEGGERPRILEKYLGPIVYTLSLADALERGILPKFEWKVHPVTLALDERAEFEKLSRRMTKLFSKVSRDRKTIRDLSGGRLDHLETLHEFVRLSEIARYRNYSLPEEWKYLLLSLLRRRWIMHRSTPKLEHAIRLVKGYGREKKCVVFTMDIESCEKIARESEASGIDTYVIHSQVRPQRLVNERILRFRRAASGVLVAPRMLDEGIDIPDAEIGINAASSKTRLQLVQRIGRILRMRKGKHPEFHHLIAIPERNAYLPEEDGLQLLDDLSWIQETALRVGVRADVLEADTDLDFSNVRRAAEESLARRFLEKREVIASRLGTINVGNIVSRIPTDVLNRLMERLNRIEKEHVLSDAEWSGLVRISHGRRTDEGIAFPGFWWILVIGGRNPRTISGLLRSLGKNS